MVVSTKASKLFEKLSWRRLRLTFCEKFTVEESRCLVCQFCNKCEKVKCNVKWIFESFLWMSIHMNHEWMIGIVQFQTNGRCKNCHFNSNITLYLYTSSILFNSFNSKFSQFLFNTFLSFYKYYSYKALYYLDLYCLYLGFTVSKLIGLYYTEHIQLQAYAV